VIHLERVILPAGLRAVAYRDARGNLVIYVSESLDAACQRAAVVEAIRAARRTRWRAALPSAVALLLGIRAIAGRALGTLKLRPLAWGATATTAALGATAAGVFITAAPHHHAPSASSRQAQPGSARPVAPGTQPPTPATRATSSRWQRRAHRRRPVTRPAPANRARPLPRPQAHHRRLRQPQYRCRPSRRRHHRRRAWCA